MDSSAPLTFDRSLGDFEYKQLGNRGATEQLVSPEPDLFVVTRNKERDQLLILACDGIWDVFENDALANYVLQRIRCVASLTDVCAEILDTSLHKVCHFFVYLAFYNRLSYGYTVQFK